VLVQAYLMMSHDKTPPVERMYSTRGQHGYENRKTTEGTEKHNVTSWEVNCIEQELNGHFIAISPPLTPFSPLLQHWLVIPWSRNELGSPAQQGESLGMGQSSLVYSTYWLSPSHQNVDTWQGRMEYSNYSASLVV